MNENGGMNIVSNQDPNMELDEENSRTGQQIDHHDIEGIDLNPKTIKIGLKSYQVKHEDVDEDLPGNDRFETHEHLDLSSIPWKIYILCAVLDLLGFVYMVLALVFLGLGQLSTSLLFGIFTFLLWTPGIYFTIVLIRARRARSPEEREEIISQIPI